MRTEALEGAVKPRTGPTPVGQRLRAQTIPGKRKPAPTIEEYDDMAEPMDWPTTQREFWRLLGHTQLRDKPSEFRHLSPNFMTDEVLGYVEATDGSAVEVSTGVMPVFGARPRRDMRIYGVTWPPTRGKVDERSKMCESLQDVAELLGYGDGSPA